jgi:hypothetical protein
MHPEQVREILKEQDDDLHKLASIVDLLVLIAKDMVPKPTHQAMERLIEQLERNVYDRKERICAL